MAKKKKVSKKFMVCDCLKKSVFGKKKKFEGIDCTCYPYPNGSKRPQKYEQVFITSIIE